MPIAKTKAELLAAMEDEYQRLRACLDALDESTREEPGVCGKWSAKDVVAHLVGWKQMFLGWYADGLRGGNPTTPAEDLKWNQLPQLNDRIYRRWKDESFRNVMRQFHATYAKMLELAQSTSEKDLFRKNLYPWMRVWPLARWIAANTSSHYRWGRTRIRRWANSQRRAASLQQ